MKNDWAEIYMSGGGQQYHEVQLNKLQLQLIPAEAGQHGDSRPPVVKSTEAETQRSTKTETQKSFDAAKSSRISAQWLLCRVGNFNFCQTGPVEKNFQMPPGVTAEKVASRQVSFTMCLAEIKR